MGRGGRFFAGETGVRCALCPRRCQIPDGGLGFCGARGSLGGKGVLPFYGRVTALAVDPIEKKPLFHFRPGTDILSVGFAGCNLGCPFCQNWRIARAGTVPGDRAEPGDIVSAALDRGVRAIAYTYSEPLVHAEFLLDCMSLARKRGVANVLVTNGCAEVGAAGEILSLADAANIDLKCFSPETYGQTLGGAKGAFEAVLAFVRLARVKRVHVEITTLVVPGMNDSPGELDACAGFIASLDAGIPWHLSAYHPNYWWKAPPTDPAFLLRARERAGKKLSFVYTGNIPGEENVTLCHACGAVLVRRLGYRTETAGLANLGETFYRCAGCGVETGVFC
ncbi:MAG: AmmeMemoRadiSam system radical SAM enzyme [Treponema sp.]|nr:AmmeMemoRadiSam system radical SAM enzyme [Treponema sp.]